MDAYRILGLSQNAGEDEIKSAYRALAQKYNPDSYESGPLKDEASAKMAEINAAFDELMGTLRTGDGAQNASIKSDDNPRGIYAEVRNMINNGDADGALSRLGTLNSTDNAEWNFLMGSAYYYKGWLQEAARYFNEACRLAPDNREYAAAYNNMRNSQRGNMNGNPYGNPYGSGNYRQQAGGCSCCDMCATMACLDMCCNCGGGGC